MDMAAGVLDMAYMQDMYCQLAGVLDTGIRPHQDGHRYPHAEPFRHAHDHAWLSLARGRAGAFWVWLGGKCRRAGLQGRMVLPCRGISGQALCHTCIQLPGNSFRDQWKLQLYNKTVKFSWM